MKKVIKDGGITLIALVITIIILLILAGISIAMLTGDNGILSKTTTAKAKNEQEKIMEQIKLAIMASRINEKNDIDLSILENELKNTSEIKENEIEKEGENGQLPWKITHNEYMYQITEEGQVIEIKGISLNRTTLKLVGGESQNLTATKTEGINGNIIWISNNSNIEVTSDGKVTAKEGATGTAIITAKIEGTIYEATCMVTIVERVTQITPKVETIEVSINDKVRIEVTTTPSGTVEDLKYESSNIDIATVDEKTGIVTGVKEGTTTITIKGTITSDVSSTVTVIVTEERITLTAAQIAAEPEKYYGRQVLNYNTADKVNKYRIFYVDKKTDEYPNGYFGDIKDGEEYHIYLKADYKKEGHFAQVPSQLPQNTKVINMNPEWSKNRIGAKTITLEKWNTLNSNERAAAWFCNPTTVESTSNQEWKEWFDPSKADYVIGGSSIEMYVKSYNQVPHIAINYVLGANYRETNAPGYIYTLNGEKSSISNDDYTTGVETLDTTVYEGLYTFPGSGYWWLSSPSSFADSYLCIVNTGAMELNCNNGAYFYSPVISLKSGVNVQIDKKLKERENINLSNRKSFDADGYSESNIPQNAIDGKFSCGYGRNWYGGTRLLIEYNEVSQIDSIGVYTTDNWGYAFSEATIYYSEDDSLTLDSNLNEFKSITVSTEKTQELQEIIKAKRVILTKSTEQAVYEFECFGTY